MTGERRSFLRSLLSAASGVLVAAGTLLAPRRARATGPDEAPKYGVPAKKRLKKKDEKKKEPPDAAPEYGVRRPPKVKPKQPPKAAPEYGVPVK